MNQLTLKEIEAIPREYLIPREVAQVLGCHPHTINVVTKNGNPFPFPVIVMGTRVRIPKMPFVKFMRGEEE